MPNGTSWVRVPTEIIERYGYGVKLCCWIHLEKTRAFADDSPTLSIRELAAEVGVSTKIARVVLADYRSLRGTLWAHQKAHPNPPPASGSSESGHTKRHTLGTVASRGKGDTVSSVVQEEEGPPCIPPVGEAKTPKKRRRTAAPESIEITDTMRAWFRENFGDVSSKLVLSETEKFLDHHRANGTLRLDWNRAWQTWMRNWRTDFGKREPRPTASSWEYDNREY